MKVVQKMKSFYKRHENKVLVVAATSVPATAFAADPLDISSGTEQLGLGLAAVGALGLAKLAPAALAWVWTLVTRVAQR